MEGRLAETALRPRPRAPRSSGSLSGPTIPVSPQAAGPAVPERGIGPGRVPGCSAMPGAWKSQPAPGKAQGFRGQDTVERYGGLGVVMEKIVQREQEDPDSKGHEMIDDFRLRGSRTWRRAERQDFKLIRCHCSIMILLPVGVVLEAAAQVCQGGHLPRLDGLPYGVYGPLEHILTMLFVFYPASQLH